MVQINPNKRKLTDAEFDAWWASQSEEKKQEWLEYSREHLVGK